MIIKKRYQNFIKKTKNHFDRRVWASLSKENLKCSMIVASKINIRMLSQIETNFVESNGVSGQLK